MRLPATLGLYHLQYWLVLGWTVDIVVRLGRGPFYPTCLPYLGIVWLFVLFIGRRICTLHYYVALLSHTTLPTPLYACTHHIPFCFYYPTPCLATTLPAIFYHLPGSDGELPGSSDFGLDGRLALLTHHSVPVPGWWLGSAYLLRYYLPVCLPPPPPWDTTCCCGASDG